jgi:hypothetical protein
MKNDELVKGMKEARKRGINFITFKMVVGACLVKPSFSEEFWIHLYESYCETLFGYDETVEEWAEEHFMEWTNEGNGTELKTRQNTWINADYEKPEYNVGVLVFIPEEDNHITSGMWDVSNKWVLLDEYRKPECKVTHWRKLPPKPIH